MATQQPSYTTKIRTGRKNAPSHPANPMDAAAVGVLPQAFLELVPDAIIVADAAGKILLVNHQAEVLFGYARRELMGSPVEVLLPGRLRTVHEQHRMHYLAMPHTRPMGTGLELLGQRKDGSEFPVEVSLSLVLRDNDLVVMSIVRDISARKRLERERNEQAEQLRLQAQLIDAAHDAVLVRDPSSRIISWNHGAEELYGWTALEALGQVSHTLFQTHFTEVLTSLTTVEEELAREGRWEGEVQHTRADGSVVLVESRQVVVRDATGNSTAVLEINRDLTARRRLEAAERLAADQLKDDFISVAAHELRTPLTTILGFASMLEAQVRPGRGPELADWQHEAIGEIEVAAARMNALIDDLLDVTRIQAGRVELHLVPVELLAIVNRCMLRVQMTSHRHSLSLEVEAPIPSEPVMLEADEMRLEQVLGNLLSNAVKYSPLGGPVRVTVRADRRTGVAEVHIRDTGIGIPAKEQAQMFQRFARASNVHEHQIPGSGLGLFVCRELVERHGGHIWFESAEGLGTTFFLTLPLQK
ncbi:MAG: PAS domain S-box protein [Ktedonobacterales bacterium]